MGAMRTRRHTFAPPGPARPAFPARLARLARPAFPARPARPVRAPGYTLIELLFVLSILGVLLAITMPPLTRWLDAAAVHAARDELAGGLALTRVAAVSGRGATLVLDPAAGRFWIRTEEEDGSATATDLARRYRVRIDVGASTAPVLFHYDALGIGRLANRTVRVHRGRAEAGLTVSAYGRFRRW